MKRKILEKLLAWKEKGADKTAVLIDGARRVGKSYIAEQFAKENYRSYILIDFNRAGEDIKALFENYLNDLDTFFLYLSVIYGKTLYKGESLIIFDEGMIFENVVAQMFSAVGHKLYFYSNPSRNDKESRMEIDFLLVKSKVTNCHNISPVEIKSGRRYTASSIEKFSKKYNQQLNTAYILRTLDYSEKDGIVFLPVYMAGLL